MFERQLALRRTRVALAEMPGMLGDIVRHTLARSTEVELVANAPTCALAAAAISSKGADVLVVGRELSEGAGPDLELLRDCAHTTVLGLSADGRQAYRYELRAARIPLTTDPDGVSPQMLLEAIRAAASSRVPERSKT